jgi:flagellar motility protein MotE (MotC chaperone)
MKKLLSVIAWTLALNFLAAIAGVAWLYSAHKLDREKIHQIKDLVFAPATQPTTTEPTPAPRDATTQPTLRLEEMMAKVSGRSASEQVEFMQTTFNAHMALLDRRFQDLQNQRKTIEQAKAQVDKDRQKLLADQKQLATAQQDQTKLLTDQGFQDTLNLYNSMQPRQVKTIFMSMSDDTMIKYLRAMEPRIATKIIKEFKTADETDRVGKVMEKMRQAQASTNP